MVRIPRWRPGLFVRNPRPHKGTPRPRQCDSRVMVGSPGMRSRLSRQRAPTCGQARLRWRTWGRENLSLKYRCLMLRGAFVLLLEALLRKLVERPAASLVVRPRQLLLLQLRRLPKLDGPRLDRLQLDRQLH